MSECMTQEDAERMNNEQAIAILKPLRDMMRDQYGCPISDAYFAVGKAIEVLSQPKRIKGRWIRKESDLSWWYECSECGESPLFDPYEHEVRTPFCPWCGARMEEEEDETD